MLDLKFAELHNPLFLAGKNFGLKLDPAKLGGLRLQYDRSEKELLVHYSGETGIIPSSNVASMICGKAQCVAPVHPIVAAQISAQVETPQSHVFAGEGQGKTGKSK